MKKYFLQFILSCIVVPGIAQQKIAVIDPGKNFSKDDHAICYYNGYENKFRVTLQNDNVFTRLLYDSNFNLTDSFSFISKVISFNNQQTRRYHFLTEIVLPTGDYEVYANKENIFLNNRR